MDENENGTEPSWRRAADHPKAANAYKREEIVKPRRKSDGEHEHEHESAEAGGRRPKLHPRTVERSVEVTASSLVQDGVALPLEGRHPRGRRVCPSAVWVADEMCVCTLPSPGMSITSGIEGPGKVHAVRRMENQQIAVARRKCFTVPFCPRVLHDMAACPLPSFSDGDSFALLGHYLWMFIV
ncbi:LSU m3Psi1915 methyltransferase RlmH [Anopheles sinensis]|uniref:LSU m3Psi1915 methyltransferase RlmH n=1 Tax=Anopheles sinensis TaxID=74873 RepID=A0A084WCI3_ANOSI|nr:LSU m3Psi1915 methyltransferase RlmH [Anopheles sinensis]